MEGYRQQKKDLCIVLKLDYEQSIRGIRHKKWQVKSARVL